MTGSGASTFVFTRREPCFPEPAFAQNYHFGIACALLQKGVGGFLLPAEPSVARFPTEKDHPRADTSEGTHTHFRHRPPRPPPRPRPAPSRTPEAGADEGPAVGRCGAQADPEGGRPRERGTSVKATDARPGTPRPHSKRRFRVPAGAVTRPSGSLPE